MPTYQYLCTECGGQLEAVQKFTDEPLTVHDDCGGRVEDGRRGVRVVLRGRVVLVEAVRRVLVLIL